jgi:hypothetical protein
LNILVNTLDHSNQNGHLKFINDLIVLFDICIKIFIGKNVPRGFGEPMKWTTTSNPEHIFGTGKNIVKMINLGARYERILGFKYEFVDVLVENNSDESGQPIPKVFASQNPANENHLSENHLSENHLNENHLEEQIKREEEIRCQKCYAYN